MTTFKIYTLGCKVNQYDSASLKEKLNSIGFQPTNQSADLIIINTCSVTKNAHRKDRQIIKKAKIENPGARVVVMGCWSKVYPELAKKVEADLFWSVGKLDELILEIKKIFKVGSRLKELGNNFEKRKIPSPGKGERARYFMKVQDGCEQFCSYCVIPYSRGKLKSRNWQEIIKEAQKAEEAGYEEINLCGIHLGLYGVKSGQGKIAKDKDKKLAWLIRQIIKNTKQLRVRISSIEVNDITDELIQLVETEKRFCNHLHIPLQGGEDKLLRLMNRPYDTKYFKDKIEKIRKVVPDIAITTDVIVGFPSETEGQFQKTIRFIKELKLSKLHVFPYSKHERTIASKIEGHLDGKTKQIRSKKLRELSDNLWAEYQKNIKNKYSKLEVLIEKNRAGEIIGKTEYYFDIKISDNEKKNKPLKIGKLAFVKCC